MVVMGATVVGDDESYQPSYQAIFLGGVIALGGAILYGGSVTGSYSPIQWVRRLNLRKWEDVGKLKDAVWNDLRSLRPLNPWKSAIDSDNDVYVASCTLDDGRSFPCVDFVVKGTRDQERRFPSHGFIRKYYRFDDKTMIDAKSVVSVRRSPCAPPSMDILQKLASHGHWDDPIMHAKLILKDGRECWVGAGNRHFVSVPEGYTAADIVDVKFPPEDYDPTALWNDLVKGPDIMLCMFQRP
jgi:hypothetical protein